MDPYVGLANVVFFVYWYKLLKVMYLKVRLTNITSVVYWYNLLKVMHDFVGLIKTSCASLLAQFFKVMPLFVCRIKLVVCVYWINLFKVMHPSCKWCSNMGFFKIKRLIHQIMAKLNTYYYSARLGASFHGFAMNKWHLEFFLWAIEFLAETVQVGIWSCTSYFPPSLISTTSKVHQISPYPNGYVFNMAEFDFRRKNCPFYIRFLIYCTSTLGCGSHLRYLLGMNFIHFKKPVESLCFIFIALWVHVQRILHLGLPRHLIFST
jgi:hypothetical protein